MQLALPLLDSVGLDRDRVVFIRHVRARRYILRVMPDGTVRVTLPRWGVRRDAQAFVDGHRDWIARQHERQRVSRPTPTPPLPAAVVSALRVRAANELPIQLRALAEQHGIAVTKVSVRNQRSRWGACSSTGTITLNWRLIQTPDYVCEYVMLHELMHRREMNHSRRFWRLVAECCPRHAEARRWLRTEGKTLWSERE